jgi:hypothetical protein
MSKHSSTEKDLALSNAVEVGIKFQSLDLRKQELSISLKIKGIQLC